MSSDRLLRGMSTTQVKEGLASMNRSNPLFVNPDSLELVEKKEKAGRAIINALLSYRTVPMQNFYHQLAQYEHFLSAKRGSFWSTTYNKIPILVDILKGIEVDDAWAATPPEVQAKIWNYLLQWYAAGRAFYELDPSYPQLSHHTADAASAPPAGDDDPPPPPSDDPPPPPDDDAPPPPPDELSPTPPSSAAASTILSSPPPSVAPSPVTSTGRAAAATVAVTSRERGAAPLPAAVAAKKTAAAEEPKTPSSTVRSWKDLKDNEEEKVAIGGRHLAALGLDWTLHETSAPPLFYPIRIIEHKEIFTRTAYLSFHISKEDKEPPRILLMDGETVEQKFMFSMIDYATGSDNEKEKTIMFLMYKDNPVLESKAIRLGFFNLRDKTECQNLIQYVVTKQFNGWTSGVYSIHKGTLERKHATGAVGLRMHQKRFVMLCAKKFFLFKNEKSTLPSEVVPLNVINEVYAVRPSTEKLTDFHITASNKVFFSFRAASHSERDLWIVALSAEKKFLPTSVWQLCGLQSAPTNLAHVKPGSATPGTSGDRKQADAIQAKQNVELEALRAKLRQMNIDQRVYFDFINTFRDDKATTSTNLWTLPEFQSTNPLPYKSFVKHLKAIHDSVAHYHHALHTSNELLRHCRVVCREVSSDSGGGQIGFSFPGFDTQVFDVGSLAVVSPWQFFSATDIAFQTQEWQSALRSKCAAKELMQSSPDFSNLFDSDPTEAKKQMKDAQLRALHNLFLAAHMKRLTVRGTAVYSGETIEWKAVVAAATDGKNKQHSGLWNDLVYEYNPTQTRVTTLLNQFRKEDATGNGPDRNFTGTRLLCDPLTFLQTMRCIVVERLTETSLLLNKLDVWHKTEALATKKTKAKLVNIMVELRDLVKRDEVDFKELLVKLPSYSELQRSIGDVGDAAWQKTQAAKHTKTPSVASIFGPAAATGSAPPTPSSSSSAAASTTAAAAPTPLPVSIAGNPPQSPAPSAGLVLSAALTGGLVSPAVTSSTPATPIANHITTPSASASSSPTSPSPSAGIVLNTPTAATPSSSTPSTPAVAATKLATAPAASPASSNTGGIAIDHSASADSSAASSPLSPVINDVISTRAVVRDDDLFDEPDRGKRAMPIPRRPVAKTAAKNEDDALIASIEVGLLQELAAAGTAAALNGGSGRNSPALPSAAPIPITGASSRATSTSGSSSSTGAPPPVPMVSTGRVSGGASISAPAPLPPNLPARTSSGAPPPIPTTPNLATRSSGNGANGLSIVSSPPPSPGLSVAKLATAPAKSPTPPPVPPTPTKLSTGGSAPPVPPVPVAAKVAPTVPPSPSPAPKKL